MAREEPLDMTPLDAQRPFARQEVFERIARTAHLETGAKVLELAAGVNSGGLWLASALGCVSMVLAADEGVAGALKKEGAALGSRLSVQTGGLSSAGLPAGSFDAILVFPRRFAPVKELVELARPLLALNGRLCITYPVKVGIRAHPDQMAFWERELKEALQTPSELLGGLLSEGFEPEWVETLSTEELDRLYRAKCVEVPEFDRDPELELHRQHGARSGVTFALAVGRRREPNEKPPRSRDRG
jgi:hypothetical protein